MKLVIGWLYPELLNLYGDRGNIECLVNRCKWRNIGVEVVNVYLKTQLTNRLADSVNLIFMGGGPDSSQKELYRDFTKKRKKYIIEYIQKSKVGLFICGGYQLLGKYYKPFEGEEIPGISAIDMYTEHLGRDKPRCVGNLIIEPSIPSPQTSTLTKLVGFENHGGRTYLGAEVKPLGRVIMGYGNNGEDGTEGAVYKNTYGSYMHGPILPKNPQFADLLIIKALGGMELEPLDDRLEILAHGEALKLRQ